MIGHVIRFKLERKEIQPENVPLQSQLLNTSAGILNVNPQHTAQNHHTQEVARECSHTVLPLNTPVIHRTRHNGCIVSMPTSIISLHLNSHSSD